MTSLRRQTGLQTDLRLLEESFEQKLAAALRECATGHRGLFGANDAALLRHFGKNAARYLSVAPRELLEQGAEIKALRARLGYVKPNRLVERFEVYSANATMPNTPGEPKLAQMLLNEISPADK